MKNYDPFHGDKKHRVKGSGPHTYRVGGKRVDEVQLRFDESTQKFYARIINPSQHTQYLCQQGKLGLALCKLNNGSSVVRCDLGCRGIVANTKRPRWRRCSRNQVVVNNLNEEIVIEPEVWNLKPPKHHSIQNDNSFYTKIKAILLHLSSSCDDGCWDRGYKTYCNAIAINVDANTEQITVRNTGGSGGQRKYQCQLVVTPTSVPDIFHVQILNANTAVLEAIENHQLCIATEESSLGRYSRGGGQARRAHFGYQNPGDTEFDDLQYYKRWEYRKNQTYFCSRSCYQFVDTLEFDYQLQAVDGGGVSGLKSLMKKHRDFGLIRVPISAIRLVITYSNYNEEYHKYRVGNIGFGTIAKALINNRVAVWRYNEWSSGWSVVITITQLQPAFFFGSFKSQAFLVEGSCTVLRVGLGHKFF